MSSKVIGRVVVITMALLCAGIIYYRHQAQGRAMAMMDEIEKQFHPFADRLTIESEVIARVTANHGTYSKVPAGDGTSTIEARFPGIPTGAVFCDTTGDLKITFHFDRQGYFRSYESDGPRSTCL